MGAASNYLTKVRNRLGLEATRALSRRQFAVNTAVPLISFTFDDFPRSAFLEAGSILRRNGVLGTYYTSLSLMAKQSRLGPMFHLEDLKELHRLGHEIGCHTFGHCNSWATSPDVYEEAIVKNKQALSELIPGALFQTFAYPFSAPQLMVKRVAARHFMCCRCGGLTTRRYFAAGSATFNSGDTDLNLLSAFFLEKSRDNPEAVKSLIDDNARAKGWLIFATHDVCSQPSPYGCTPDFFERIVQWSLESGAKIVPVVKALEMMRTSEPARALSQSRMRA